MKKILVASLVLAFLLAGTRPVQASIPVEEGGFPGVKTPYEINPDAEGGLWISNYDTLVLKVDPGTGAFTQYTTVTDINEPGPRTSYPADARRSGDYFFWVDGNAPLIGRAAATSGAYTLWEVPGASTLYGTALDSVGRLWATDGFNSLLYRLEINGSGTAAELCSYTIPEYGLAQYLAYQDPYLWLADYSYARLMRIDTAASILQIWQLPSESSILGISVDPQGELWFADGGLNILGEFDPDSNLLASYPVPAVAAPGALDNPQMIALVGSHVWYTTLALVGSEYSHGAIGRLDPTTAQHSLTRLNMVSVPMTTQCLQDVPPKSTGTLAVDSSKKVNLSPGTYNTLKDDNGWQVYQMATSAVPWGIAYSGNNVWAVDNTNAVLVKIPQPPLPPLTIAKSAEPASYQSTGDIISYTYVLTNTGITPLTGPFSVADDKIASVSCPVTDTLAPGASITCTASYTVKAADITSGWLTNVAYANGTGVQSEPDSETVIRLAKVFLPLIQR